jgi:Mor family transcriptional regulator
MPQSAQYPEILSELADCILHRLCMNLPSEQAGPIALSVAEDIRARFGGCLLYIPKGDAFARAQRNRAIAAEFDGNNYAALARRHGLTLSTVYDIIAREKKAAGTAGH